MAGEVEGIVSNLGLFYTTLVSGGDRTMIPNNVIMMLAVIPISEPERVELKARFNADVTPQKLQRMIEKAVTIPLRNPPQVRLEELARRRGHGDDHGRAAEPRRRGEARDPTSSTRSATAISTASRTPTTCRRRPPSRRRAPDAERR